MEKCIQSFEGGSGGIYHLEVSDEYLYSHSYNNAITRKFNKYGKCIHTMDIHISKYEFGIWCIIRNTDYLNLYRIGDRQNEIILDFVIHNNYFYTCGFDHDIHKRMINDNILVKIIKGHVNRVTSLISHDGFLYSGSLDRTIRKWNDKDECIKIIQSDYLGSVDRLISYNGWLYSNSYFYDIDNITNNKLKIQKWKDDRCVQILESLLSIYSIIIYNGCLYSGSVGGMITKWGEYWPHLYSSLPPTQKLKLKIWRSVWKHVGIHKDLAFLFDRELLI